MSPLWNVECCPIVKLSEAEAKQVVSFCIKDGYRWRPLPDSWKVYALAKVRKAVRGCFLCTHLIRGYMAGATLALDRGTSTAYVARGTGVPRIHFHSRYINADNGPYVVLARTEKQLSVILSQCWRGLFRRYAKRWWERQVCGCRSHRPLTRQSGRDTGERRPTTEQCQRLGRRRNRGSLLLRPSRVGVG